MTNLTQSRSRFYRRALPQNPIIILILLLLITSCTQTQESTPQLKLAQDFVSGHSEIPAEHYIFLEVKWNTKCDVGCDVYDCPAVELTPPIYEWYGKNSPHSGLKIHYLFVDDAVIDTMNVSEGWEAPRFTTNSSWFARIWRIYTKVTCDYFASHHNS